VLIAALLLGVDALAQKGFEGRITYAVSYLDLPDGQAGKKAALPAELLAFIDGENLRVQQYTSLAGEWTIIQPADRDTTYHCFYLLDDRVMIKRPRAKQPARYRVVARDDQKAWEQFQLTAHRLQKSDGGYLNAWMDERYQNPFQLYLPELKYLPLIFELERGGVTMRLTAIEVDEVELDPSYFQVPDNVSLIQEDILLKLLN
jgi:hypothetical protein